MVTKKYIMDEKDHTIDQIVAVELEMFLAVPTDGPYACQTNPDGFRLHRRSQFSCWPVDALKSYLQDLHMARERGVNLMSMKYLRMEGRLGALSSNPLVEKISAIQYRWQQAMIERFPNLMAGARPLAARQDARDLTSFETYLRGELETYSDRTLELLYQAMCDAEKQGINWSEKIYDYLIRQLGYDSIEQVEKEKKTGNGR